MFYTANQLKEILSKDCKQYKLLMNWMDLFWDVPENFSIPAFRIIKEDE